MRGLFNGAFKTNRDEATAEEWLARQFPDRPQSKVQKSAPPKTIAAVVPSEHPVQTRRRHPRTAARVR
jgi:hypothetical protein